MKKTKDTIKDIYKGEVVDIWQDEESVTLAIYPITVRVPVEEWEDIKKDIKQIAKLK